MYLHNWDAPHPDRLPVPQVLGQLPFERCQQLQKRHGECQHSPDHNLYFVQHCPRQLRSTIYSRAYFIAPRAPNPPGKCFGTLMLGTSQDQKKTALLNSS
jgi:hypothetical protein